MKQFIKRLFQWLFSQPKKTSDTEERIRWIKNNAKF